MILSSRDLTQFVESGAIQRAHGNIDVDLVSIGLHLDQQFVEYAEQPSAPFVPPKELKTLTRAVGQDGEYVLAPHGAVLACSEESVTMPCDLMGFIQTKGSLARGFLMAHTCDGQVDPGYNGKLTLELVNFSSFYYRLTPGMPIAQLFLVRLSQSVEKGYSGRYLGADGPTPMRVPVAPAVGAGK